MGILDQEKLDSGRATVISGDEIRSWLEMPDKLQAQRKWDEALDHDQLVWARVSPAHKLLIVENCQVGLQARDSMNSPSVLLKGELGMFEALWLKSDSSNCDWGSHIGMHFQALNSQYAVRRFSLFH